MSIRFTAADWIRIHQDHEAWWRQELDRPLVPVTVSACPSDRAPGIAHAYFLPAFPAGTPIAAILDAFDYDLSTKAFLGDAYPRCMFNYGPGFPVLAFGAMAGVGRGTVWFEAPVVKEIDELDFSQPNLAHPLLEQQRALIREAGALWGEQVQLDMSDLSGVLDILQVFRPGEGLMLDLYDEPEEVLRCAAEIETTWWALYEDYDALIRAAGSRSYGNWGGLYCASTSYLFQCDFAYMIGPDQFKTFVLPTLRRDFARVERPFYHLDGPGELPHVDQLLAEERLAGIQWVPGAGQPRLVAWVDLVRRIRAAGKLVQVVAPEDQGDPLDQFIELIEALGSGAGIQLYNATCRADQAAATAEKLAHLGVPPGALALID